MSTEATPGTTSVSERVTRESTEAWDRGDLDAVINFYDENCSVVQMHDPETVIRGRDGMRAALDAFHAAIDMTDGEVKIVSLTSQGDRAVTEVEVTGTYRGEGAPAGGARITLLMCAVFIVENGLVREERAYMDNPAAQIGRQLAG